MLKWTVNHKRNSEKCETLHPLSADTCTAANSSAGKQKRRRPSSTSRRSSTSKRNSNHNRNSAYLQDKENQFTSTPIKSIEDHGGIDNILRDVSNLTPNDTTNRRRISISKKSDEAGYLDFASKHKKKKRCLDPEHAKKQVLNLENTKLGGKNYFRPFESVDSHITSFLVPNVPREYPKNFAPTLPALATDYSPCRTRCLKNYSRCSSLPKPPRTKTNPFNLDELYPPNKRPKIDHVNDFLHRISFITSPEDERIVLPKRNVSFGSTHENESVKVSPLVQRLVDLRFSRISPDEKKIDLNDSSLINELSVDEIVNAILDSSCDISDKENESTAINETKKTPDISEVEVELTKREKIVSDNKSFNKSSSDSGFRSTSTENSHQIGSNYKCKCTKDGKSLSMADVTIIDLGATFNERCVDENVPTRKRASVINEDCEAIPSKRSHLESSSDEKPDFTLKRQKCIRRRRGESSVKKQPKIQANNTDNSFESWCSSAKSGLTESTPKEEGNECSSLNTICNTETPVEVFKSIRRTRRCLLFESPKSDSGGSPSLKSEEESSAKGILDLSVHYHNGEVVMNVFRCKDLHRSSGKQINAYVKVALYERVSDFHRKNEVLQRTAVQADSNTPTFNHVFKFPLQKSGIEKQMLLIEVWHRDRSTRRSEFLGCMSFPVKHAVQKSISGSYRLLPQSTGRCQNAPVTSTSAIEKPKDHLNEENSRNMCESHSSVEEILSFDDIDNELKPATNRASLTQQQKDADENLFLRYLELDPTEGPDAIPAATQRKATGNKNGRTPFTTTKKLMRAPKSGFGFSVVWTHPPRIERVEKGLPADKAGILPGDYIIFVDKQNVVMMPEIDILNLIRSYGNQLTLEIFRRNASRNGSVPSVRRLNSTGTGSTTGLHAPSNLLQRRPSTVCSTNTASVDYNRRKLQLPQVTFSSEKNSTNPEESRKKAIYQLISKEQQYATGLQFAVTRFVSALAERKDLITPSEHKLLFQNSEEILRITEEIIESVVQDDGDIQINQVVRTYRNKLTEIISAYKRYCSGIKRADCILASKTKNVNSDFVRFLQSPAIPRRRPDITVFIHKPLEHYREILKLLNVVLSQTKPNHEDYAVINQIVHDMQVSYREITVEAGLMEPTGEGRPLLTVQDLESRMVFTKCKPFVLSKPGRHWIFGGDLSRVEGRNIRQYWTLLFNDLLLFAKVSRDRVLFITEEPIPLSNVSDLCFNVRKKANEFRISIEPGGKSATSPTIHCGPDLTRTPKKNANKKTVVLRAPTLEMKAVWQNLLQRQIFHINSGMDSSSFSSPLESPEVPITSSVVTLQSAESFSNRRQTPESAESQRQIDALIEHKCKQLSKANSGSKGNAIHLEQWMKGQLGSINQIESPDDIEPEPETWSEDMLRKRSEELQILDFQGIKIEIRRNESRCEELTLSDQDQSPSRSTTTESQVTVRSSPVVPETLPVCRQCHKTCLTNSDSTSEHTNKPNCNPPMKKPSTTIKYSNENEDDAWQPLMLMGLNAATPAASLVRIDPFSKPLPQISVVPATPESSVKTSSTPEQTGTKEPTCNCSKFKPKVSDMDWNHDADNSTDDSPMNEEHPYHSLSSSNLTLRRYGTVSSLERLGTEEMEEKCEENTNSSESEEDETERGIDNEAFNHTSLRNWTVKAGSFVFEKMAFFERYLKATENQINGDDLQEEETSGGTSGEEIWGTPTSGGEMDDPLSSPNYDGRFSPDDSMSSENDESTELMMDELLMTPPIASANIRGLLPRRTLEPLLEEEYSDSCSSSSTQTEPSVSPDQGNETGDAADTYLSAVAREEEVEAKITKALNTPTTANTNIAIHRSESYRHIIEAEDENAGFINRFKPNVKFIDIERAPRSKTIKIFGFFNVRRERRVHESFPEGKHLIKLFSKDDSIPEDMPTTYLQRPSSPQKLKDKQMDRRFWKQLSRRRGNKSNTSA